MDPSGWGGEDLSTQRSAVARGKTKVGDFAEVLSQRDFL